MGFVLHSKGVSHSCLGLKTNSDWSGRPDPDPSTWSPNFLEGSGSTLHFVKIRGSIFFRAQSITIENCSAGKCNTYKLILQYLPTYIFLHKNGNLVSKKIFLWASFYWKRMFLLGSEISREVCNKKIQLASKDRRCEIYG